MPTTQQSPRRAGARQTVVAIIVPAQPPQGMMIRAMCLLLYVNRYAALKEEEDKARGVARVSIPHIA